MVKNIVISQPMFFPWRGIFEQVLLADIYVHYDDVQFSKRGCFTNRVQIKTENGFAWLTVPLRSVNLRQNINEKLIDNQQNWQGNHISLLTRAYRHAPFYNDVLDIIEYIYSENYSTISDLSVASIMKICSYFAIAKDDKFHLASRLGVEGKSWNRIYDIVKFFNGSHYITGHGAKNYLDHDFFEKNNINVQYMNYRCTPYPQLYGEFNPYVSILDLIANTGKEGLKYLDSTTINWKDFIDA